MTATLRLSEREAAALKQPRKQASAPKPLGFAIHARDLRDPVPELPKEAQRPAFRLKAPEPKEAQVMRAVRQALQWHRAVAHVWRINSGSAWLPAKNGKERPVQFHDIEGCSDLIGILKGGRLLAVECKRPSTRNAASEAQKAFLNLVRAAGGVAFVAASADEAILHLNKALSTSDEHSART